jgi:Ca2+-binding EF-hand superfamily protein
MKDYDEDQFIGVHDLEQTVIALTQNELTQEEVAIVCDKVLEEADNDDDRRISFMEFQHVISRAPEFLRSLFILRINFNLLLL